MSHRCSTGSAGNYRWKMDGNGRIHRCFDCSLLGKCDIDYKWKASGPIPEACVLPATPEDEDAVDIPEIWIP
jgi:hypothetical protein